MAEAVDSPVNHALVTLKYLRTRTNAVILFYSGGKDSIVLLDMLSFLFDEIHLVFMYFIKDLEHQRPLLTYPFRYGKKVTLHQYPHWMLTHYFRNAYFCFHQADENIKLLTLKDIEKSAKKRIGVQWIVNGAKQSDSLHRSLMLRRLKFESINEVSNRVYPLSKWSKSDVISYIRNHRLMLPETYSNKNSNGMDLTPDVLLFLKESYPSDYQKLLKVFPFAEKLIHDIKEQPDKDSTI